MTGRNALLALAAVLISSSPAAACDEGDQALFSCRVLEDGKEPDESQKGFSLCGGSGTAGTEWQRVYYEFWNEKGTEFRYPGNPEKGKALFFTHHYKEHGLYRFRTRFSNGGYTYVLYLDEAPAATEPDTINGPTSGVEVFKGKKSVAVHDCAEAPETYFTYIQRATSCDLENPLGKAACTEGRAPDLK